MNKYKLIAALIVALILMLCIAVGCVISHLLSILPSPWCHIANVIFFFAMLTLSAYLWIGKREDKDSDEKN